MKKVLEKEFKILKVDEKNDNHRIYPESLIEKWISMPEFSKLGVEVEYAVDDIDLEECEFNESLSCGYVTNIFIKNKILYGKVQFKIDSPFCDKIYSDNFLDNLTIVPKGKGSIREQIVEDDYELLGFNLIKKEESSWAETLFEKEKEKV